MMVAFLLALDSGMRAETGTSRIEFVRTIVAGDEPVLSVSVSRSRGLAAAARRDGQVVIWDAWTWRECARLQAHPGGCAAAVFAPNGRMLATAGGDGSVKLWNASTWTVERVLRAEGDPVVALAFDPEGTRIAAAGPDGTHAWTLGGGSIALPGAASSVALRGEWAVTGGDEGEVRVWNLASGTEGVRLKGHAGVVSAVLIHPGGARVITGGVDHAIQVWDLRTGDKVRSLLGHKGAVRALALLPGARRVASAGMDGVRVWDLASGQPIHAMEMNGISACAVAAGLGTESIVVTGGDNRVWVWGTPRGPREEPPADTRPGGFLGVSYVDGGGALVQGVFKDSAAERAGFRVGDVIVGVDDVPVDRSEDFLNYMRRSHEGDDVHVRVQRGGESRVIRVKFGRWKDQ